MLISLFEKVDADHSGHLTVESLHNPLGIAAIIQECKGAVSRGEAVATVVNLCNARGDADRFMACVASRAAATPKRCQCACPALWCITCALTPLYIADLPPPIGRPPARASSECALYEFLDRHRRGYVSFADFEHGMSHLFGGGGARGSMNSPVHASSFVPSVATRPVGRRKGMLKGGATSAALFREALANHAPAPSNGATCDASDGESAWNTHSTAQSPLPSTSVAGPPLLRAALPLHLQEATVAAQRSKAKFTALRLDASASPSSPMRRPPATPTIRGRSGRLRRKSNFTDESDIFWSSFAADEFDALLSESDDDGGSSDDGSSGAALSMLSMPAGYGEAVVVVRRGRAPKAKDGAQHGASYNTQTEQKAVSPGAIHALAAKRKLREVKTRMRRWKKRYAAATERGDAKDARRSAAAFRKLKAMKLQLEARVSGGISPSHGARVYGVSRSLEAAAELGSASVLAEASAELAQANATLAELRAEHGRLKKLGDAEGVRRVALRFKRARAKKRELVALMAQS